MCVGSGTGVDFAVRPVFALCGEYLRAALPIQPGALTAHRRDRCRYASKFWRQCRGRSAPTHRPLCETGWRSGFAPLSRRAGTSISESTRRSSRILSDRSGGLSLWSRPLPISRRLSPSLYVSSGIATSYAVHCRATPCASVPFHGRTVAPDAAFLGERHYMCWETALNSDVVPFVRTDIPLG
jgi:hypothetical protein